MNIKQCDRCGNFIDPRPPLEQMICNAFDAVLNTLATLTGTPSFHIYLNKDTEACLCKKCRDSFKEWWREGKGLLIEENSEAEDG